MIVQVALFAAVAQADSTSTTVPSDSTDTAIETHGAPPPVGMSESDRAEFDSLLASIRGDSTAADTTTPVRVREFHPVESLFDSSRRAIEDVCEPFQAVIPNPADLAVVDLADWLVLQPVVDVNDAGGPGHTRYTTRWGLMDRRQWWNDDAGEAFDWLRLGFPQSARADINVVPVFLYDSVSLRSGLHLIRKHDWPYHAQSAYVLRQGYYGETYSQGTFRRLFAPGFGIDLGFAFYETDGTSFLQNQGNRHLRLRLVGPVGDGLFWNFRFNQFRDDSFHPPRFPYSSVLPVRDDLLNVLEATVYRPRDSAGTASPWIAGITLQRGKHDIRDALGYRMETHADKLDLWTRREAKRWLLDGRLRYDRLRLLEGEEDRWLGTLTASRMFSLGSRLKAATELVFASLRSEPMSVDGRSSVRFEPEGEIAFTGPPAVAGLAPGLAIERRRIQPSLFDLWDQRHNFPASGGVTPEYAEAGNPALNAEWRNRISVFLFRPADSSAASRFSLMGTAGYVEHYTTWQEVFTAAFDTTVLTPVSRDARHLGAAVSWSTPLPWKFESWFNYAFKYAEELDHEQLTEYNPHSASWVLSWIAPKLRYNIDIRLNSTLLWWVGDSRYQVTPYASSPHVIRWDLSGTAQMKRFVFHYSLQNVTNFPYRTESGGELAVQRMRFGISWQFVD